MTDPLDSALNDLVPSFAGERADWRDVLTRAGKPSQTRLVLQRHPRRAVAIALALVLVALLATPAFGVQGYVLHLFGRKNVSFSKSPSAPNVVKKQFLDLPRDAPRVFSLQIEAAQTRVVATFSIGGHPRKLWVVPTKQGGYCFMFELDFGSCRGASTTTGVPIGVSWQGGSPGRGVNESIVTRVGGDVTTPTAARITAHYADGTSADIPFVWVSRPIAAGFFTYDVPAAHWSPQHRLLAITLSTKSGKQLARQSFPYETHPRSIKVPLPTHVGTPKRRALPSAPAIAPSSPTQTGSADGFKVVVGHNGAVQFTQIGETPILRELVVKSAGFSCFRLTKEFGIFTVRSLSHEGRPAGRVGFQLTGVGAPVDGCEVQASIGRTWPDRLHDRAAVEIPLTPAGRRFFADRQAARDLALFVRSRRMQTLRKEPAAQAKTDILRTYGKQLAHSPIVIDVIDRSTLRFSERSTTGKMFSVTVRGGRIEQQDLKPYGFVF